MTGRCSETKLKTSIKAFYVNYEMMQHSPGMWTLPNTVKQTVWWHVQIMQEAQLDRKSKPWKCSKWTKAAPVVCSEFFKQLPAPLMCHSITRTFWLAFYTLSFHSTLISLLSVLSIAGSSVTAPTHVHRHRWTALNRKQSTCQKICCINHQQLKYLRPGWYTNSANQI